MSDNRSPSGRDEFRVVLRGYDREQVDAFIMEVAERIDALERERAALAARLGEGGDADQGAEIDAVTAEINRILHAAHEAAEGMRSRASEDAATWRAEADAETRLAREEAQAEAEAVRGDAWATSADLLDQVKAHSARLTRDAEQEALNIRAEAERDAQRHMAQARQDAEEAIRHSRLEADRMTEEARRESHNLVEAASLEAEAAQQRARALEERRTELMAELDIAQGAISKLESDLAARKEALLAAGNFEDSTVRVVTEEQERAEWFDPDETVRVVAADVALAEPEPVDAMELADEVRELRERRVQAESAVAKLLNEVKAAPEPESPPEPVAEEPELEPEPSPADAEVVAEPEPAPEPLAEPDPVDSLFAALRGGGGAAPAAASVEPAHDAESVVAVAEKVPLVDPFELRDRLLLPLSNRTLRTFKKELVELQNRTLEELREEGEGWRPDRSGFEGTFRDELEAMAHEALVAGYAAAAELAGADKTPHPDNVVPTNPTSEVAGALFAEVDDVAQRASASGAGHRQATAAVSRVFRTWRTDAAERHLRAAALASYHDGVLWGLESLGVDLVKGVADGRMCAECPASVKTAWSPTDSTPKGTGIPPVHLDCSCAVVPA